MKPPRRPIIAIAEAGRHRFWRWPLAFALALAVAVSLFHDLPALAGGGGSDPVPGGAAQIGYRWWLYLPRARPFKRPIRTLPAMAVIAFAISWLSTGSVR